MAGAPFHRPRSRPVGLGLPGPRGRHLKPSGAGSQPRRQSEIERSCCSHSL
jgi:hypothetical protein